MTVKRPVAGFTLVEVMIAAAIVPIVVLGAFAYRYNAALDTHKAQRYTTAARVAMTLCESWSAAEDAETFNPARLTSPPELTVAASRAGPETLAGFTALGKYVIDIDSANYYAALSWKNVSGVRALNVVIAYQQAGHEAGTFSDADRTFRLTTYSDN